MVLFIVLFNLLRSVILNNIEVMDSFLYYFPVSSRSSSTFWRHRERLISRGAGAEEQEQPEEREQRSRSDRRSERQGGSGSGSGSGSERTIAPEREEGL